MQDAFERIACYDWGSRHFSDTVKARYQNYIAAFDSIEFSPEIRGYRFVFLMESTIEVIEGRMNTNYATDVKSETYPLRSITKVEEEYATFRPNTFTSTSLERANKTVTIHFGQNQKLVMDIPNDDFDFNNKIADLNTFVNELRKRL